MASLFRFALHLRVDRAPFLPALASRRFRLAGQSIALTLVLWLSEMRVVSGRGGRPNGMTYPLWRSLADVAAVWLVLIIFRCSQGTPVRDMR